jgi:hypothetical protein
MTRKIFVTITGLILLLNFALPILAAVPHLVRYQGYAADSNGVALEGQYNMTFRIYDAPNGGTKLWEETQNSVPMSKGNFSVLLGQVTALNLTFDKDCWLAIQVSNDAEMIPRQRITSVPLAIRAEKLDNSETMSPVNIAKDGSFDSWSAGTNQAPDAWTLSGTGASTAQSTTKRIGSYSATLTAGSDEGKLTQVVANSLDYANNKLTLTAWVKCSTANSARIFVNDGTANYSGYHTGGGQWEVLSVTKSLSPSPTSVSIGVAVAAGKSAQFDGVMLASGENAWGYTPSIEVLEGATRGDILYFDNGWKKLPKSDEKRSLVINNGVPVWGSAVTQASVVDDTTTQGNNQWQDKLVINRTISPGSTVFIFANYTAIGLLPPSVRIAYGTNNTVIQQSSSESFLIGTVTGLSGPQAFKLQFNGTAVSSIKNARLTVMEF